MSTLNILARKLEADGDYIRSFTAYRAEECIKKMAWPLAYNHWLDLICTIPDGQSTQMAREKADIHWREFVPEEYRDLV